MVHKQSVSLTATAFNFGSEQVEGEMQRRLALPFDSWEPIGTGESITTGARAHLARLAEAGNSDVTLK